MNQGVMKESSFDEVRGSQRAFRILLDSMSRPGKIYSIEGYPYASCPEGFNPYILTILKTLGDNNVTFCILGSENYVHKRYIEINTGMSCSGTEKADFVLVGGDIYHEGISGLNCGTLEFPEENSTAVFAVDSLLDDCPEDKTDIVEIAMRGPGVKDANHISVKGLDREYIGSIMRMNSAFPLGIDVIFADKAGRIACMPRTTSAEVV